MRFIFKTEYDQDIRLVKHGGGVEQLHLVAEHPVGVLVAVDLCPLPADRAEEQLQGRLVPLGLPGRPPVGGDHADQHR